MYSVLQGPLVSCSLAYGQVGRNLTELCVTRTWKVFSLYVHVFFALFVGRAFTIFQQAEVVSKGRALAVIGALFLFLVVNTQNKISLRSCVAAWSANRAPLISFAALLLYYGCLILVMGDNYVAEQEDYWVLLAQPVLRACEFSLSIGLGALIALRSNLRPYCVTALCVMCGSVIAQSLWPAAYNQIIKEPLPWAAGFGVNRNVGATTVVLILAMTLDYSKIRLGDFLWVAICGASVFLTESRAGLIKFGVIILFYMGCNWRRSGSNRFLALVLALLAFCSAFAILENIRSSSDLFKHEYSRERHESLVSGDVEAFRDPLREELIERSLQAIEQAPLFGHGYWFHQSFSFGGLGPHNEYLKHAVDGGVIALSIYIALIINCLRCFRSSGMKAGLIFCTLWAIESFFSHNLLEDTTLIILLGTALGYSAIALPCRMPAAYQRDIRSRPQLLDLEGF